MSLKKTACSATLHDELGRQRKHAPLRIERRDLAADGDDQALVRDAELGMVAAAVRRALCPLGLEPRRRNFWSTAHARLGEVDALGFGGEIGLQA